ncbi:MAG: DHHA1 domain-containing protein [bacterium]
MLNQNSKILSISHNDMDGVGCQIVLGNVFKNITYVNIDFKSVDADLRKIDYKNYDYVFITDIHPDKEETLNISNNIILLDHHDSAKRLHNVKKKRFIYTKKCATILTKRFVENLFDIKLEHLDWLCTIINDYDMWIHEYPLSKRLNLLFYKYFETEFRNRFFDGVTKLKQKELYYVMYHEEKLQEKINELEVYDLEKVKVAVIIVSDYLNDLCDYLLRKKDYRVIIALNKKNKSISLRGNVEKLHLGNLLNELQLGGGHKNAAGLKKCYLEMLNEYVNVLEDIFYKEYPEMRKK